MRTKKESDDKTVNYYYNGGKIVLETDKDNAPTARNIWGLKLVYRENNPGQTDSQFLYYLHNAHGDVTQLLNEKGELIKDYRYDTFGQEEAPEAKVFGGKQTTELWRQEVEKIDNPFRYAGEYLDEETGNYYLRARYYDPNTQRFINEDSFGVSLGTSWKRNLYNYVGNNPVRFIDPTGHTPYNANGTWIDSRDGAVRLRDISFAYGGSVSWNNKTKKAQITVNEITHWFSTKDYYTEKGSIWIKANSFYALFGIKPGPNEGVQGTSQTKVQKGNPQLAAWCHQQMYRPKSAGEIAEYTAEGMASAYLLATGIGEAIAYGRYTVNYYTPINPGPLEANIANTFRSASYSQYITTEETTLYRVFGGSGNSKPLGPYWTRTKPQGPVQSIIDSALDPKWGNNATQAVEIRVPKGVELFEGVAAPQGGLVGGGNQIYIRQVDPSWIVH